MGNEELAKLTDEIKTCLNSERIEKIQSVLNDILEEVLKNQCILLDESMAIELDLTLKSTQRQEIAQSPTVFDEKPSSLLDSNPLQVIKSKTINFITCVLTPQGVKCR